MALIIKVESVVYLSPSAAGRSRLLSSVLSTRCGDNDKGTFKVPIKVFPSAERSPQSPVITPLK